ncbi:prion-inhibition and propagation-domain-containing protein [Hypoxylon trugodes]|uniref:prion-inhibition and propagation-domain-containing protein n=1 Tax=Hypoxylon trugodes TaxID=326681 RepID=UPI002192B490|nr:prion-inhibition and propagation-domain-containing protein [Hypoxylon trugodes]KAI1391895.1 prion-inhibition and propagation-domain-containing protein [Hypoxylon trugodes]
MAEAVGLGLSAIALIGVFKDCIDLFSFITASQNLESDYKILNTKLDVEKTLLLQWADRVKLADSTWDSRLDNLAIRKDVEDVLLNIYELLSASDKVRKRYGLVESNAGDHQVSPTISSPRATDFIFRFKRLTLQSNREGARRVSKSKRNKILWVIRDKGKFEKLLNDVSYFVSRLNELLPDTPETTASMMKDDIRLIRSIERLQLIIDSKPRDGVVTLAKERVCELRILDIIGYQSMNDRQHNVSQPHKYTLHWALEPSKTTGICDNISQWLRTGSGTYWLGGKAGSGKSTLMKFIYDHDKTKSIIEEWAGDTPWVMASFFFWNIGSEEQKSQKGLVRALLYQVLDSKPSLIKELLPRMWEGIYDRGDISPLPNEEMEEIFTKLARRQDSMKFCFFIDGLDEFAGNYMDGISFIKTLTSGGNMKVIVSSRPEPAMEAAFSKYPKLRMQDLTRKDIIAYIQDVIGDHEYMTALQLADPKETGRIINELVEKASGVFLWVVLACRSLLDGFAAFDRISELRRRVDELPPELDNLFKLMLLRVDSRYRRQTAKFLKICYHGHLMLRTKKIPALGLSLVDEHDFDLTQMPSYEFYSNEQRRAKCLLLEGRLRSRCGGLLEFSRPTSNDSMFCFCQALTHETECNIVYDCKAHDTNIDANVEFMHRTVFEFLDNLEVWDLECLQIDDSTFCAAAVLSAMSLHSAQLAGKSGVLNYMRDVFLCAARADQEIPDSILPVFWKFADFFNLLKDSMSKDLGIDFLQPWVHELKLVPPTVIVAVELGMVNFLRHYDNRKYLSPHPQRAGISLLYHAVSRSFSNYITISEDCLKDLPVSTSMVRFLIDEGCSPNETPEPMGRTAFRSTPWIRWLKELKGISTSDPSAIIQMADVTEEFLRADVDMSAVNEVLGKTLEMWITQKLTNFSGFGKPAGRVRERGRQLLEFLQKRQQSVEKPHASTPIPNGSLTLEAISQKRSLPEDGNAILTTGKHRRLG